ncbi:peptidylprolyl isomerase [Paenibacillus jamilae]|uniref:Peptidylprolyl isomerase n=1 Tax=Paenibacillus jamilae TaxID=114136 RepID=A0ACC4ZTW2_9BACL|nr:MULTISPECIES: copper amine oxidase N-terminal domain-containing protein [Paenibacillus]AUO05070.1 peptidylprolyl isomerase [Paenibacillus sp. lzh-N1]KTS81898.1 peptidylprolyl isomerase [Paenibacillus jamilae]
MMKRFFPVSVFLIFSLVLSVQASATKHPYSYTINVQVNGVPINFGTNSDSPPYIENGTNTAFVPLRFVSENLGGRVRDWDKTLQQVTIESKNGTVIKLAIGSKIAYVNDEEKMMLAAPQIPTTRVQVPLRVVSEVLGAKVDTQKIGETLNVNITTSN